MLSVTCHFNLEFDFHICVATIPTVKVKDSNTHPPPMIDILEYLLKVIVGENENMLTLEGLLKVILEENENMVILEGLLKVRVYEDEHMVEDDLDF